MTIGKDVIEVRDGSVHIKDREGLRNIMDGLIYDAVFETDEEKRKHSLCSLKRLRRLAALCPPLFRDSMRR
ncbi:MAG: hypothetical protein QMC83_07340 [Thermodesulfovibrionales bacterium]|nr:hypothetical protein [Thermodesulfovibrionales bacterium]